MTRAPLLRQGAVAGSCLTVLGIDAEDRDPDLVVDPADLYFLQLRNQPVEHLFCSYEINL
jgi:hypothetical protein